MSQLSARSGPALAALCLICWLLPVRPAGAGPWEGGWSGTLACGASQDGGPALEAAVAADIRAGEVRVAVGADPAPALAGRLNETRRAILRGYLGPGGADARVAEFDVTLGREGLAGRGTLGLGPAQRRCRIDAAPSPEPAADGAARRQREAEERLATAQHVVDEAHARLAAADAARRDAEAQLAAEAAAKSRLEADLKDAAAARAALEEQLAATERERQQADQRALAALEAARAQAAQRPLPNIWAGGGDDARAGR